MRIDECLNLGCRRRCVDKSAPMGEKDEANSADRAQPQLARFASGGQVIQRDESGTSLPGQDHRLQLAPMQPTDGTPDEGFAELLTVPSA